MGGGWFRYLAHGLIVPIAHTHIHPPVLISTTQPHRHRHPHQHPHTPYTPTNTYNTPHTHTHPHRAPHPPYLSVPPGHTVIGIHTNTHTPHTHPQTHTIPPPHTHTLLQAHNFTGVQGFTPSKMRREATTKTVPESMAKMLKLIPEAGMLLPLPPPHPSPHLPPYSQPRPPPPSTRTLPTHSRRPGKVWHTCNTSNFLPAGRSCRGRGVLLPAYCSAVMHTELDVWGCLLFCHWLPWPGRPLKG